LRPIRENPGHCNVEAMLSLKHLVMREEISPSHFLALFILYIRSGSHWFGFKRFLLVLERKEWLSLYLYFVDRFHVAWGVELRLLVPCQHLVELIFQTHE
jgi:hypothetical protein